MNDISKQNNPAEKLLITTKSYNYKHQQCNACLQIPIDLNDIAKQNNPAEKLLITTKIVYKKRTPRKQCNVYNKKNIYKFLSIRAISPNKTILPKNGGITTAKSPSYNNEENSAVHVIYKFISISTTSPNKNNPAEKTVESLQQNHPPVQ